MLPHPLLLPLLLLHRLLLLLNAHESQDSCESESQGSGDSDCDGPSLDTLRLGGEDFRFVPLTYGAGRAKLEQR